MSELAVAAYASRQDVHLLGPPPERDFKAFARSFDELAYLADLAAAGLRWLGRSDAQFPSLLRSIHDPPVRLFLRGRRTSRF